MAFKWFKQIKKNKETSLLNNLSPQKLIILPILETDQQIDFIYKIENSVVLYLFDLSFFLHSNEKIANISYETSISSLKLKKMKYDHNQFSVVIEGGWDNCKSTLLFTVETNTKQFYQFTVLVTIISNFKNKVDLDKKQRASRLWALDRDPDENYLQKNQDPWIEGDMILNINNQYLWEYRYVDQQKVWFPLFNMNGVIEPVPTIYSDAKDPGERLILNHIHSDQGKIKSNADGNLSIKGEVSVTSVYTKAVIAGHPLGEGMLFTSQGMMAGHSLYIGSPEAKPKNIYIGMPGVVSTKLVSADYLQLAPLSIKDIPSHVTKGTLILCYDYIEFFDLVLLYATKDNPQLLNDWKPLFSSSRPELQKEKPLRPTPSSRPHLYPVSFNPSIQTKKSVTGNIVKIRSVANTTQANSSILEEDKHLGVNTYTRFQFDRELIPASVEKQISWKNLIVKDLKQQLKGEGQNFFSESKSCWKVPVKGLLHIQAELLFLEEPLISSEPVSYHAGDQLLVNIACNQEKTIDIHPITQLEFMLVPYINDVKHKICAHQHLSFSLSYPVEKEDKITFLFAYIQQHSDCNKITNLPIKKATISLFMS